ncbi:MAG: hypothetical protein LBP72_00110 [Dysgonamonadaceae bacterium]|jgi:hypothetical protein|nr:hypothetical protein [Dysgonamonadaceae bacterium]
MLNHNQSYDAFIGELRKKIPKNPVLVNMLTTILCLEKEAIYRRLRQDVPFSFYEIVIISKKFGISLDNIVGIATESSIPLQLRTPDFINPQEVDYSLLNAYTNFLKTLRGCKTTEAAMITNTIPYELFSAYPYLVQYNIFDWQAHCCKEHPKPFHELSFPDRIVNEFQRLSAETKYIPACFVFDKYIFRRLVNTIHYFSSIRLIEKASILKIKNDLLQMIDYIEDMAVNGVFRETACRVNLYISDMDITTNYAYIVADNYKLSFFRAFLLTSATSVDEHFFEKVKNRVQSFIRTSTLITITNEKQRILYFEKQRKIVNEL